MTDSPSNGNDDALRRVLWLGGGSGAGKSTLARMLAFRCDLRLYRVDSFAYPHQARVDPVRHPNMARLAALSPDELFVAPSPRRMAEDFGAHAREAFTMVVEDLNRIDADVTVLAEGPSLLPELVAPVAASREHALFLLPTPEFNTRNLAGRFDPQRADPRAETRRAKRGERDRLLTEAMRSAARRLELPTFDVDGSLDLEQTFERLHEHFAPALAAGRGFRDGVERAEHRRAENLEVLTGVRLYLESLGDAAPAEPPPVDFACECSTLGCDATVPLSPYRFPTTGMIDAH